MAQSPDRGVEKSSTKDDSVDRLLAEGIPAQAGWTETNAAPSAGQAVHPTTGMAAQPTLASITIQLYTATCVFVARFAS